MRKTKIICTLGPATDNEVVLKGLVENGMNGYKIDAKDLELIEKRIHEMLSDKQNYIGMANNALKKARLFCAKNMISAIETLLQNGIR